MVTPYYSQDDLADIQLRCPACRAWLALGYADVGHLITCPECGTSYRVEFRWAAAGLRLVKEVNNDIPTSTIVLGK